MNINLAKLFGKRPFKNRVTSNRRLIMISVCIAVSCMFWLLTVLNKQHVAVIRFPIVYANIPENKVAINELQNYLNVEVSSQGWDLLIHALSLNPEPIMLNIGSGKKFSFFSVKSKMDYLKEQISSKFKIINVTPDTIYFNFETKMVKTVPVKLNASITYAKQYDIVDKVEIIPDSIAVSGPVSVVAEIDYLETEQVVLNELSTPIQKSLKIIIPDNKLLFIYNKNVELNLNIDKFTENTLEVPIEINNSFKNHIVKIFPAKTTITYLVALSKFDKVTPNLFKAVVNLSVNDAAITKLNVQLVKQPSFIKSVKINPLKVDFLLIKKDK